MNKSLDSIVLRYVGFGLLFLGTAYLLYLVRGALPIFFVAGVIAYALEPVLQRLERRGSSRRAAVGYVFLLFLLLFAILLVLLASAWQQAQSLAANISTLSDQLAVLVNTVLEHIKHSKLPAGVRDSMMEAVNSWQTNLKDRAPGFASGVAQRIFGSLGTICVSLVLVPIITLWFMIEANPIRGRLLMIIPPAYRLDVTDIAASINELLGRYVRGQMIVCTLFGTLCTIGFEILSRMYGMQYPLVLGAVAAIVYIVPYVGMAVVTGAAGLTAYFTATAGSQVPCAIAAVSCCVVFNLVVDYGISPRVLGQGVGLHPLMVIFALLCGAQLGGPIGMIFAVPFFASLRVIAIYLFPQLAAPIPESIVENQLSDSSRAVGLSASTSQAEKAGAAAGAK